MANLLDNFTDTNGTLLTAHTSDSGHTWVTNSGGTSWTLANGRAYAAPSFTTRMFSSVVPASADYDVDATYDSLSAVASSNIGTGARCTNDAAISGYYLRFIQSLNGGAGGFRLDAIVAGTTNVLSSVHNITPAVGTPITTRIRCVGNQITAWVNSTQLGPYTSTHLTAAGLVGTIGGGAATSTTTGLHMTQISSTDAVTSSAGADQTDVEPYTTVTLTGTGTAATWTQTGGTPTVTLGGSGATRTFEAPATMDGTTLTFTYGTDPMTVTVLPHNEWWRSGSTWQPLRIITTI